MAVSNTQVLFSAPVGRSLDEQKDLTGNQGCRVGVGLQIGDSMNACIREIATQRRAACE